MITFTNGKLTLANDYLVREIVTDNGPATQRYVIRLCGSGGVDAWTPLQWPKRCTPCEAAVFAGGCEYQAGQDG